MLAKGHKEFGIAELPTNEETALALTQKYANLLPATTKEGYEAHRVAIGQLVKMRTSIESRRVEIKAEPLEKCRRIDAFAKHWTTVLEQIEAPIRAAKKIVDDAAEKVKRDKENAERLAQEEAARKRIADEEAAAKAKRDEEQAKIKAEQEAKEKELAAERAKLQEAAKKLKDIEDANRKQQEEVKAKQRADQEKIDTERRKLEEDKKRAEREEFERQAKIKAEQLAKEKVERERIEAEQKKAAKEKADKEEAQRIEAMRSDVEKVHNYAGKFLEIIGPSRNSDSFAPPKCKSKEAQATCDRAYDDILKIVKNLAAFQAK
jgi:chromosome segregation ATPase